LIIIIKYIQMSELEEVFCTKPGQNKSKIQNHNFKKYQSEKYKLDKNAYIYNKDFYNRALYYNDKTHEQA